MIQADYFISQIIPEDTFIKVMSQESYIMNELFKTDGFTIYQGKAKDINLRLVSSYDIIQVEPKNIEEYHSDKTTTVYLNALEILVG